MCTALRTSVELSAIHHQCIPIDTYFFEFFSCSHLPFGLTLLFLPFWGNSSFFPHHLLCNSSLINLSLSFYLFIFLSPNAISLYRERAKIVSPVSSIAPNKNCFLQMDLPKSLFSSSGPILNSIGTVKNPKTIYFDPNTILYINS